MAKHMKWNLTTTQIIAFGFFCAILIGTILLCLPVSSASGQTTPLIDSLFTSTTSVCVTGLVVVQTSAHWSLFGQIVILCLIQLGGLGIVTFTTAIMMIAGKQITLYDRLLLEDAMNLNTLSGLIKFLKKVLKGTFLIEGIGFIGYSLVFVPEFGLVHGLGISLFNAVSAFCNAGMDVIGADSLSAYLTNPWVNLVTMFLIVMGGIGFIVWMDIASLIQNILTKKIPIHHCLQRLRLHTKIVLLTTAVLIFGGACLIFLLEFHNPDTIGLLHVPQKMLASLFQSVTTRTAGFLTFSQKSMHPTTVLICLFLMFIGGSSIGTAGGIKTSTAALLFLSARSTTKGDTHVVVFHKRIPHQTIKKALAVTMVSSLVLIISTILLYELEGGPLLDTAFETTSAIATVGLTRDYTAHLHTPGKLIIILLMYLGRIGPISMAIIFGNRQHKALVSYPEEDITVG
ncbi:MAG: potassium transporter TrkG [Eubacteriales bacterium]|nr:potassium transporter TrkG [Eubacteriales bacterium]